MISGWDAGVSILQNFVTGRGEGLFVLKSQPLTLCFLVLAVDIAVILKLTPTLHFDVLNSDP